MFHSFGNKRGYAWGEAVITLVVISSLALFAIPQYFRVRRNVNMELVKQHLRVMGQDLNEFYNKNKQFPVNIQAVLNGQSSEELALATSLNAIQDKGYEVRYFVSPEKGTFVERAEPQPGMERMAGNKCFILDPVGVRELPCWSGEGMGIKIGGYPYLDFAHFIQSVLKDFDLKEEQKATILAGMIDYFTNEAVKSLQGNLMGDQLAGYAYPVFQSMKGRFDVLFPKIHDILKTKGIRIYGAYQRDPAFLKSSLLELPVDAGEYQIGAQVDDLGKNHKQDDIKAFEDYVHKTCSQAHYCNANLNLWGS